MSNTIYIDTMPTREVTYRVTVPKGGWRRSFDPEYAEKIRPIAETLAMLDGNAFHHAWQNYLPEADAVYRGNGGDGGLTTAASSRGGDGGAGGAGEIFLGGFGLSAS